MLAMKIQQTLHADQRYLVIGLGLTGYSVASYLMRNGYDCVIQDDRDEPPYQKALLNDFPSALIIKTALTPQLVENIDCLVVSPGLSTRNEFIQQAAASGKRIVGDIELFAEAVDQPVLAITGSNGKSTVTTLLGEMIRADGKAVGVGGNLGVPALDLLSADVEFYVLELSSFQLETTRNLNLLAATVLNISEDHMDRYHDLQDYQRTKQGIYRHADNCISNMDDVLTVHGADDIQFSLANSSAAYGVIYQDGYMLAVQGEGWIRTADLKLKGRHNWANCLAAMALARTAGISKQAIITALKSFAGLPHRSQWVAEINGVNWINDSKATNPGAVKAAVEGMDDAVILLAGGQGKGADMTILRETLKKNVKTILLFGEDAESMAADCRGTTAIERVDNLQQAVLRANDIAEPRDIVLLSPACASFDQFSGFEQRGDAYCRYVEALKK